LPADWVGCSVEESGWGGDPVKEGLKAESGPMLILRHPDWSEESNQNIPIMVFTKAQWKLVDAGDMHVGAAPFWAGRDRREQDVCVCLAAALDVCDGYSSGGDCEDFPGEAVAGVLNALVRSVWAL
jgi:hypothetical protein